MSQLIKLLLLLVFFSSLNAKTITPSEVYSQVILIQKELHSIMVYYNIKDSDDKVTQLNVILKPRNVWQKSYEIMIKINILRNTHNLPSIKPVNMTPVLHLNPDLVYEQTQRILTELKIFKLRLGLPKQQFDEERFFDKTPSDVFNGLNTISTSLDLLNQGGLTPSFVFTENMKVYDDISLILNFLEIEDKTIPRLKNKNATPYVTFETGMDILNKIKYLQINSGLDFVDFSGFRKKKIIPSDVFSLTQMILAELQTIKAYIGLKAITPHAANYKTKTPIEVDQLMSWNLRKLNLIQSLKRRKE